MSRWWRKRRGPLDLTDYHVRRADVAAGRVGGLMMLAGTALLIFVFPGGLRNGQQWRVVGAGVASLTIGLALFAFGEMLRRRQRLWVAQALLALSGSLGVAFAGVLTAATFEVHWARALTCPTVLGLLLIWPVIWHASRAVRQLRSRPTTWTTGFQPLVPLVAQNAPLPVMPLPPLPPLPPQTPLDPDHRSDSSR